jgi:hypothetical protein
MGNPVDLEGKIYITRKHKTVGTAEIKAASIITFEPHIHLNNIQKSSTRLTQKTTPHHHEYQAVT